MGTVAKQLIGLGHWLTTFQRTDRIKSTLFSDLDKVFATALTSDADKTKSMADVLECLRTYDVLGLWREAEEIIRRNVVDSFLQKVRGAIFDPAFG